METPENIKEVVLWAWVGEDEFGSGEVGLKRASCPAGDDVPMVACKEGKMDQDYLKQQIQDQANYYGKTIRLCKFVFAEEIVKIAPEVIGDKKPIVINEMPCPRCRGHERLMQRCVVCGGLGKIKKKA